jgi:PhnB protein
MQSSLHPYLNFRDTTRAAMEFYQTVFGGKVELHPFSEFQMPNIGEDEANKVMHGMITADNGISFFAADTPNYMEFKPGSNISMSLSGDNDAELSGYFEKLSDGGKVVMPLNDAPWGDKFGMCVDKFGVSWMVNISKAK